MPEAAVMPGTTRTATPRCSRYWASSPPRPKMQGSPPLSLQRNAMGGGELNGWLRLKGARVVASAAPRQLPTAATAVRQPASALTHPELTAAQHRTGRQTAATHSNAPPLHSPQHGHALARKLHQQLVNLFLGARVEAPLLAHIDQQGPGVHQVQNVLCQFGGTGMGVQGVSE